MAGPAPFGVLSPGEAGAEEPGLLDKLVAGIINGTVQIPKHVIDAAASSAPPGLRREDYTDKPAPQGGAPFGLSPQAWQPGDDLRAASMDTAAGLAGVGTSFAVPGAAGVFGGRLAATADKAALARAEEMAAGGADRQAIWDKTGWFKGSDEKWRFEITDNKSRLNPNTFGTDRMPELGSFGPVAGHIWHPDFYKAYPDARGAQAFLARGEAQGAYSGSPGASETLEAFAPTVREARDIGLHELQHGVQAREGFAGGGSPSFFTQSEDAKLAREAMSYRREIAKLDPALTPKQKDDIIRRQYEDIGAPEWLPPQAARDIAHDVEGNPAKTLQRVMELYGTDKSVNGFTPRQLYRELPGEIEARNVQRRAGMTADERRATPPWLTEDITPRPVMNEIFGGGRVGALESRGAR